MKVNEIKWVNTGTVIWRIVRDLNYESGLFNCTRIQRKALFFGWSESLGGDLLYLWSSYLSPTALKHGVFPL